MINRGEIVDGKVSVSVVRREIQELGKDIMGDGLKYGDKRFEQEVHDNIFRRFKIILEEEIEG